MSTSPILTAIKSKEIVKNSLVIVALIAIVGSFYSVFLTNTAYPYYDRLRIFSDVAFFDKSNEIYPLWNPYRNGGFPVLSSPEHFYVISQFVDTNSSTYNLQLNIILLSLILCIAYASYILFKKVACSTTLLSICGAITITCNQSFLVHVQTGRIALLETFLFTVCALIFTDKYLKHKKLVYFTLVALCCGLSFAFVGHYSILFPMSFIFMFALWHNVTTEKQGKLRSILLGGKYSLSVLIVGIIACGFYTFPLIYYQMKGFSPIAAHTGSRMNCPSIDTLPGITLPLFLYGKTVLKQKAWPFVSYIVLPTFIAFFMSYKSYRVQRQMWAVFLFILFVVPFLLFGMPHIGPLLIRIYLKIPLLSLIKHSIVASQIIVFSVALISVVCFQVLLEGKIYWWRYSVTGFVILCVALSYLTLFPLAKRTIQDQREIIKRDIHVKDPALRNIFQTDRNNFSDSQDHKMKIFNSDGSYRSALSLSNQYLMNGFSLYFPTSYAMSLALLSGRVPAATRPYQVKCNSCNNLRLRALDLLSITHLLCNKNGDKLAKDCEGKWYKRFENTEIDLYARQKKIEYLKTFRKWEPINNDSLLELANASLSAFSNGIVLIDNIESSGSFDKPSKQDELKFERISEGHIHITANVESPAYLVIPENYSKEWKVDINGDKRKLINAFGGYMAVKLDSGLSEVELKYRPLVVYISMVISLVTIFTLIILCISRKKSKNTE